MIYLLIANEADLQEHKRDMAKSFKFQVKFQVNFFFQRKNLYPLKKIQFSITEINRNKNNCNSSNQK